jgi:hypothetical protein
VAGRGKSLRQLGGTATRRRAPSMPPLCSSRKP